MEFDNPFDGFQISSKADPQKHIFIARDWQEAFKMEWQHLNSFSSGGYASLHFTWLKTCDYCETKGAY